VKSAKPIVMAACAMLMFTTFAAAQYGRDYDDRDRGYNRGYNQRFDRGRSPVAQAVSNLMEASNLLHRSSEYAPGNYFGVAAGAADDAARTLQQGMADAGMNPNRIPPPERVAGNAAGKERAAALIDRTRQLLQSRRELNGDLREQQQQALEKVQFASDQMHKYFASQR
jgi:hypothetical protein